MPRLENWSVGTGYARRYRAPEIQSMYISGVIYDDEKGRFEDGKEISTSMIHELNLNEGYAQTRNTKYTLGEPDKEYIEWLKEQGLSLEDYIE